MADLRAKLIAAFIGPSRSTRATASHPFAAEQAEEGGEND
jgi:hypothetical protein